MAIGKPVKIIGILFLVILLVIIGGAITLMIMFPPVKIKDMTLPYLETSVGREVAVEKVGFTFYPIFGIKLKGLSVENTSREGFEQGPFFRIENFLLKIKVIPLLKRKLEIASIIFDKPEILIEIDKEGRFNFDDLAFMQQEKKKGKEPVEQDRDKPKKGPALPIPLTLEEFKIVKGTIKYFDHKANRFITFGDVSQEVDFSIDKKLEDVKSSGELVLSGISVKTGEIPKPLSNVSFTLSHDVGVNVTEGSVSVNSIRLSLQKIFINLTGDIKNFNEQPEINIAVNSDKILIADVIKEIPVELAPIVAKLQAQGFIKLALNLAGTVDSTGMPDVKGTLALGKGHIKYADLPKTISNIHADVHFTHNRLEITKLGFTFGNNPVMLRALVWDFKQPNIDGAFKGTFNLADIKDFVPLPEGTALSGIIQSNIKAKGKLDPENPDQLWVDGTVALTNLKIKTPELAKEVNINGTVNVTPRQIKNKLALGVGTSDIQINSNVSDYQTLIVSDSTKKGPRPKITFSVVSTLLNLSDLLKENQQASTEKSSTPSNTSSTPPPVMAAPLPGVDMQGSFTCKKFVYENVAMTDFNTNLSSVKDVMTVATKANIYKGSMSNNLRLNAKNINNVSLSNKFNVSNIDVNEFISNFNNLLSENKALFNDVKKMDNALTGTLSLDSDIKCAGRTSQDMINSLDGVINMRISNGEIKGGAITQSIGKAAGGIMRVSEPVIKNVPNGANILGFLTLGTLSFRSYKQKLILRDQFVIFDPSTLSASSIGDWEIDGKVGFDGALAINLANKLPKGISSKILKVQNKLRSSSTGLLKQGEKELGKVISLKASKALGGLVSKELNKTMIQEDKEGRVTALYKLGGTAGAPKIASAKFKTGRSSTSSTKNQQKSPTPKDVAKEKTKEVKKEVKKVVQQQKKVVQKEVNKEVQQQKKVLEDKSKQLKKEAQKKLKKLFR